MKKMVPPARFGMVRLLVLDFDGVLTDDHVWVDQDGREMVKCSRSDGLGLELVRERGVACAVISRETNKVVAARCRKLGIPCYQGVRSKIGTLRSLLKEHGLTSAAVCYIGNDVTDSECIVCAGIGCAVADAHPALALLATYRTKKNGGCGAVREICDLILKYR